MANDLKLRVLFNMVDGATKPLRNILNGNKNVAKALKASREELSKLQKAQKDIASFRELRGGLAGTARELSAAHARVGELARAIRASDAPTRQMHTEFERAKRAAAQLALTHGEQSKKVAELRTRLAGAGIDTRHLAQHERELRASITATTDAMTRQMRKLDQLADRERRVAAARERMGKLQGTAANMAVAGYAAKSTGSHILGGFGKTLGEAKQLEAEMARIRALGLGENESTKGIEFAKHMRAYGLSTADKVTLMRDAMSVFADEHHAEMATPVLARMKFANEALFGAEHAHENERKFVNMLKAIELRGGTKDEATFKDEANMVQKVINATGGRVGGDEWIRFITRGGAAAKQLRKDAFYYQMEPLIQEMGGDTVGTGLMSMFSNIYQGKTTVRAARQLVDLGLIDEKGVEYNKQGEVSHFKSGALVGGELFKASPLEWLEQVFLPKLAAKGITDEAKIKDIIATVFTNRTASNLFTTMYMQREQIHKNERLNAGADGIDAMNAKAMGLPQGRELEAGAKFRDLMNEVGSTVLPLYTGGLAAAAAATGKLTCFLQEHSTVAKVVLIPLAALAAMLVGGGTLTIALAAVLGPLAIVKFSMATLGMQGGILARVLGAQAAAWRFLGRTVLFAGRALLMTPIGLAVAAIVGLAFLIYRYWEPIKGFFQGLWDAVREAFAGGLAGISAFLLNWSPLGLLYRAFAAVLDWFGVQMPSQFAEFGANLMTGLIKGITGGLGRLKGAITNVADSTVAWFRDKLGIRSPSRVFGELGGFITHGAALGMERKRARLARAATGLASLAVASFAPPAGATPLSAPPVAIDLRAPVSARPASASTSAAAPAQYVFHIHGNDPKEIARQVESAIERIERRKHLRIGSRLTD